MVEAALGARVVTAVNQPGGYSPSLAARCRLDDGRRVFVKAAAPELNPRTPDMLRDEIDVSARLPADLPVPRLRHVVEVGTWVVAVFDDIDGRQPATPWRAGELAQVLTAVEAFAEAVDPSPVRDLPPMAVRHAESFGRWRALAEGDVTPVDRWAADNLERLAALEAAWEEAAAGDALLHGDIRADNLLIGADGRVWLVDWPHASLGAPWVDLVLMLPSIAHDGGPEPEEVWASSRVGRGVDPDALTAMVAALDGYFTVRANEPPPPGLPHLRPAQAAFGRVTRRWLRSRTGW